MGGGRTRLNGVSGVATLAISPLAARRNADPTTIAVLVAAFAVLALVVWLVVRALERARRDRLAAWAESKGRRFEDEEREPLFRFDLTKRGRDHRTRYRTSARASSDGRDAVPALFELRYVTGHGKHRRTHHYVCAKVSLAVEAPPIRVEPGRLWDKVRRAFGASDPRLTEDAEFSDRFVVRGADASTARAVCDAGVRRTLLEGSPRFSFEISGAELLVYRPGRAEPESYEAAQAAATSIAKRLVARSG
jgi:hypothetical protein